MRMKSIATTTLAVIGAGALLAAGADSASTRQVKVGDNWFYKAGDKSRKITVDKNTRIRFRWVGDSTHNVRSARAPKKFRKFDSGFKKSGTYSKKLTRTGTYVIVCDAHYPGDPQRLTIKVTN